MFDQEPGNRWTQRRERRGNRSHIWTGLFILLIGVVALLRVNNPEFPDWIFSWQMLLLSLGLFLGLRHNFRGPAWFILMLVGGIFLYAELNPEVAIRRYILPIVLISVGMFVIFRPRGSRYCRPDEKKNTDDPLKNQTMPT